MSRLYWPAFAALVGAACFLFVQLRVMPRLSQPPAQNSNKVHVMADLRSGKTAGEKGPALAEIFDAYDLLLSGSVEQQMGLARLGRLLSVLLFVTGVVDIYNINQLRRGKVTQRVQG